MSKYSPINKTKNINFRVTQTQFSLIRECCALNNMSVSQLMSMAFESFLKENKSNLKKEESLEAISALIYELNIKMNELLTVQNSSAEIAQKSHDVITKSVIPNTKLLAKAIVATSPEHNQELREIFKNPEVFDK